MRARSNDRQNSVGSQKPMIACSGWRGLASCPTSASVSGDSLTRYQPKPLAQQSDVNTVGGRPEGTR